jgi:hypothetical protein
MLKANNQQATNYSKIKPPKSLRQDNGRALAHQGENAPYSFGKEDEI